MSTLDFLSIDVVLAVAASNELELKRKELLWTTHIHSVTYCALNSTQVIMEKEIEK